MIVRSSFSEKSSENKFVMTASLYDNTVAGDAQDYINLEGINRHLIQVRGIASVDTVVFLKTSINGSSWSPFTMNLTSIGHFTGVNCGMTAGGFGITGDGTVYLDQALRYLKTEIIGVSSPALSVDYFGQSN